MNAVIGLANMQIKQVKCLGAMFYVAIGIVIVLMLSPGTFALGFALYLYEALYLGESAAEQSKSGYLVSSLPVNRRQIVQARYLYALAALAIFCVLFALELAALGLLVSAPLSYMEALPPLFLSACMYIAFVIPPMLFWGGTIARIWALAGYVLLVVANSVFNEVMKHSSWALVTLGGIWPILIGCLFLLVSYGVAWRLYSRKEFTE